MRRAVSSFLFDLAPDGVYPAIGFSTKPGGLLHHLFTLIPQAGRYIFCGTGHPLRYGKGVHGLTPRHPALWSPDFPPQVHAPAATGHPVHSATKDLCKYTPYLRRYKIRPQKLHSVKSSNLLALLISCGGRFIWQPPHEFFSTGTMAKSPTCFIMRS